MSAYQVLYIGGSHGAGKTRALDELHARHRGARGWVWVHADGAPYSGPVETQQAELLKVWNSSFVRGIVIEGTRINNVVYRCLEVSPLPRDLWVALIAQPAAVMVAHLQARCARRGKKFHPYWVDKGRYEGMERYPAVAVKFLQRYPHLASRVHVREFLMDLDYGAWTTVHPWLDAVIAGKAV